MKEEKKVEPQALLDQAKSSLILKHAHFAYLFSVIPVVFDERIFTAEATIDKDNYSYKISINPKFLAGASKEFVESLLTHEIAHIINGHLIYILGKGKMPRGILLLHNIAMDVAIHSNIVNTKPFFDGGFNVWTVKDLEEEIGKKLEEGAGWEYYYNQIKDSDLMKNVGREEGENTEGNGDNSEGTAQGDNDLRGGENGLIDVLKPSEEFTNEEIEFFKEITRDLQEKTLQAGCNSLLIEQLIKVERFDKLAPLYDFVKKSHMINFQKIHPTLKIPMRIYPRKNRIVLILDSSGSISDSELGKFYNAILNLSNFFKVEAFVFDVGLFSIDLKEIKKGKRKKAGGTMAHPILEYIINNKEKNDKYIIMTDFYFYDMQNAEKIAKLDNVLFVLVNRTDLKNSCIFKNRPVFL